MLSSTFLLHRARTMRLFPPARSDRSENPTGRKDRFAPDPGRRRVSAVRSRFRRAGWNRPFAGRLRSQLSEDKKAKRNRSKGISIDLLRLRSHFDADANGGITPQGVC